MDVLLGTILNSTEKEDFEEWLEHFFKNEGRHHQTLEEFGEFFFRWVHQQTEKFLPSKQQCPDIKEKEQTKPVLTLRKGCASQLFPSESFPRNEHSTPPQRHSNAHYPIDSSRIFGSRGRSTEKSKPTYSQTVSLSDYFTSPPSNTSGKRRSYGKPSSAPATPATPGVNAFDTEKKPNRRIAPVKISPLGTPSSRNAIETIEFSSMNRNDGPFGSRDEMRKLQENNPKKMQNLLDKMQGGGGGGGHGFDCETEDAFNPTDEDTVEDLVNYFRTMRMIEKNLLTKLSRIYSTLLNLITSVNILSEFSYLLNLVSLANAVNPSVLRQSIEKNKAVQVGSSVHGSNATDLQVVLRNSLPNSIYFAMKILELQNHNLGLLDLATIKVILGNVFLIRLSEDLRVHLKHVYEIKVGLMEKKTSIRSSEEGRHHFNNVSFQEDLDTRENFPSEKEFSAFRKQRDMFYMILKTWESKHLSPSWNFSTELGSKLNHLFSIMEHPVNMAHLSKLFISQLILSTCFMDLNIESEISALNVDANKLAKLEQRLITPSEFSSNYQFAGHQAFFKEFIITAKSFIFMEHLKINLISQLMEINSSSFDVRNLHSVSDGSQTFNEYVVGPEIMSTLRILGKFLGLVMSLPYSCDWNKCTITDNLQINERNKLHPPFDVLKILETAIIDRKLLITIPWLVQYISMLDYSSLKLSYYQDLLNLLHQLYTVSNLKSKFLHCRNTSLFIIRVCLNWIFEQPHVPNDFLHTSFRKDNPDSSPLSRRSSLNELLSKNPISTSMQKAQKFEKENYDPFLEDLLNVSCPFLADFRIKIMPQRIQKSSSIRPLKYRHITPRISEKITTTAISKQEMATKLDSQRKLTDAFLHSQSLSVRRIIEFVTERTTSAVIKDFQMEKLLPSKTEANMRIQEIESSDIESITEEMYKIFTEVHSNLMKTWDTSIENAIVIRVKDALNALMPHETNSIVQNICMALIVTKCKQKAQEWKSSNLSNLDFYSKNISADAEKLLKSNGENKTLQQSITTLDIKDVTNGKRPSELFEQLQYLLYRSYFHSESVKKDELMEFLVNIKECLQQHNFPTSIYRVCGMMIVCLVQNIIERSSTLLDKEILEKFTEIFLLKGIQHFIQYEEKTEEDETENLARESPEINESSESKNKKFNLFDELITETFIRSIEQKSECFEKLTNLLMHFMENGILNLNYLNKKFVALFKEDWDRETLKKLSALFRIISDSVACQDIEDKSNLFMEMLADLARDMEDF